MEKKYAIKPLYPDWHITDDYYKERLGFNFYIYETKQFEIGSQFLLYYTGKSDKVRDKYGKDAQFSIIGLAESTGYWTNKFPPRSEEHPISLPVTIKYLIKNPKRDGIRKFQNKCGFNPVEKRKHRHYFEFENTRYFDDILLELMRKDLWETNEIPKDLSEYL